MSLVPGSRFPSYPHQGPEYYPPKHMGAMHLSVLVYVNSTPSVVVKDIDDYGSLFTVNLAGGSVAGSAVSGGYLPQGGRYDYGASIASNASLGAISFVGSPYSLTFGYKAYFEIDDTADTAAEAVVLDISGSGLVANRLAFAAGAAAGAIEYAVGKLEVYVSYTGGAGAYNNYIAQNVYTMTANCTVYLNLLEIYMADFVPGPRTAGETW